MDQAKEYRSLILNHENYGLGVAGQTALGDLALVENLPPPDEFGEYMRAYLQNLSADDNLALFCRIVGMVGAKDDPAVIITIVARALGVHLLFNVNG